MKRYFVLLALVVVACAMPAFGQVCPSGASWCSGVYIYDGMGNIRAIGSDTYIYDTVGRLVSGTAEKQRGGISEQDYGYDPFGNRTSASRITGSVDCLGGCEQAPTIDPLTNHITGNGAVYDAAGNLISITNTVGGTGYTSTYVYDAAGSMARATAGSDDRQFIYTADDERIATRNGQSWTWTVRGLDSKVLREFTSLEPNNSPGLPTSTRQWAKDYVWRDGQLLASVTPSGSGSATQHFHLDHLGTPRVVSNDNGVQTGIHAYYPFGAELNLTPNEQPTELMKFTGHERDILASNPNTLDYMHARYYSGTAGRFLSVDPELDVEKALYEPQMWNRYAYVTNNPMRYVDENGRERLQRYHFPRELGGLPPATTRQAITGTLRLAGLTAGVLFGPEVAMAAFTACLGNPVGCWQAVQAASTPGPGGEMPNPEAIIEGPVNSQFGKLEYLLGEVKGSGSVAKSAGKGGFFSGVLGFNKETLGAALKDHLVANVGGAVKNDKGFYELTGKMTGTNGVVATVKSVWEKIGDNTYRLITAQPQ